MTSDTPACPECSQPMKSGGLVLCKRQDDGRRTCQSLWGCASRHVWWNWADRPGDTWELCPVPQLFR